MKSKLFYLVIALHCSFYLNTSAYARDEAAAKEIIETFYRNYLSWTPKSETPKPELAFSKSFNELIQENEKVCKEKAGTDICGWGADGDIYLDAQEVEPKLNAKKARLKVKDLAHGKIQASFNVYPSEKKSGAFYERNVTFQMIEEGGKRVVDDIFYPEASARKQIQDEINFYKSQP